MPDGKKARRRQAVLVKKESEVGHTSKKILVSNCATDGRVFITSTKCNESTA